MEKRSAFVCFLLALLLLGNPASADDLAPGTCETETDPLDPCSKTLCKLNCKLLAIKRGAALSSYECADGGCKCVLCAQ
uniref:Knottin scorpion toxin-like domain-containing protein n=1 Tax=Leersia perrieri TaxID=77586 RepID=A0A0D9XIT1_9ORYZ